MQIMAEVVGGCFSVRYIKFSPVLIWRIIDSFHSSDNAQISLQSLLIYLVAENFHSVVEAVNFRAMKKTKQHHFESADPYKCNIPEN